MRLLLIRHGQIGSNVLNRLDSAVPGPPLTPLGEEQAAAIPHLLADIPLDAIYASTQIRAQLTAAPLARSRNLPVVVRDGIREIFAGDLETRSDRAAIDHYLRTILAWSGGDLSVRMPGAEDGTEVLARFDEVVAEVASTGAESAALVSHGAVIRTWATSRAHNLDAAFAAANSLQNTGVVVLEGDVDAGWHALTWEGAPLGGLGTTGATQGAPQHTPR